MKLTFIPSDFVNLSNPIFKENEKWNDSTYQFVNTKDCPVERCCYRHKVSAGISLRYNIDKLNEIRERLLSGETEVTVEI